MISYTLTGIVIVLLLYLILLYNNIIKKRNETEKAFGSVDTMLKRRYDLVPNLVEIVKQYMIYEATVLKDVTKLRSKLSTSTSNEDMVELHNEISKKFGSFMIHVEDYPELKANENFLKLQAALNETEDQIAASRRFYNATIAEYNNAIQTFPSNLIAKRFNFNPKKVFEIEEIQREIITSAQELYTK